MDLAVLLITTWFGDLACIRLMKVMRVLHQLSQIGRVSDQPHNSKYHAFLLLSDRIYNPLPSFLDLHGTPTSFLTVIV